MPDRFKVMKPTDVVNQNQHKPFAQNDRLNYALRLYREFVETSDWSCIRFEILERSVRWRKKKRVTRLEYRTVGMVHTDTRTCRRRFNEEYVLKTIGLVFVTEAIFVVYCFHVHCSPARRYRRIRGQGEWYIWRENWKNVKSWKAHVVRTHVMRKYESFDGRLLIGAACVSHISK